MCQSDVTPVTSNWVMGHRSPSPDFNTVHKCRNFDKLLEWVEEHDNGGASNGEHISHSFKLFNYVVNGFKPIFLILRLFPDAITDILNRCPKTDAE